MKSTKYDYLFEFLDSLSTYDQANPNLVNESSVTSNVRSLVQFTIPDGKLFYPEPFIASPSYLHSDLSYLHIFQYWYWLWFMFIFLICFFFISFLCTIRWCNNRVRPRRETRGVSRSKCGDLITACVPVSWAMSIIVHESTDATDLNDGFGMAELIVGVRAYQWGWEYYYPRTIDLNYNVRPSYSTFVGNSLKYNFSSGKNLTANYLWRMYQNKADDKVVTPAHLLLLPLDSSNLVNYISFRDIGLTTVNESAAFSKIRNATKIYSSHLVHTPSTLTSKYNYINSTYVDENSILPTSSFGVKKQHNNVSSLALGNSTSVPTLDSNSFDKFLSSTLSINSSSANSTHTVSTSPNSLLRTDNLNNKSDSLRISSLLVESEKTLDTNKTRLHNYSSTVTGLNDNSDKAGLSQPSTKATSLSTKVGDLNNNSLSFNMNALDTNSSITTNYNDINRNNYSTTVKEFNLNGPNSKVLANDQSIRSFPALSPNKANLNLSSTTNTLDSNLNLLNKSNKVVTPVTVVTDLESGNVDYETFNKLSSNRSFMPASHPAVMSSSNLEKDSLGYDRSSPTKAMSTSSKWLQANFIKTVKSEGSAVGDVFVGSREKTPQSINSAYWTSFWSNTNPTHRVNGALRANIEKAHFYLPYFSAYADYDFRNEQAIDMLEELFWESNTSSYNFYDYMTISKDIKSSQTTSNKDFLTESNPVSQTLDNAYDLPSRDYLSNLYDNSSKSPSLAEVRDLSLVGDFYSNNIQLEDSSAKPSLINANAMSLLPFTNEMLEMDDSFMDYKTYSSLFNRFSTTFLGSSSYGLNTKSYISVFNHFMSDFESFTWNHNQQQSLLTDINSLRSLGNEFNDGTKLGLDVRVSNPTSLRPSVRNSIVNYNAFQKVFKSRLDESRAHVNSLSFSELGLKQPFLSDSKVPYLQLLGKNRDSFFTTPLYYTTPHKNFNAAAALLDSVNTPMYDFPFLLAKTSDTTRFTWIDWFAKWKYVEVQPSSLSKYSTLGAPYLRKPFDFNSSTGDKFQNTELYFTRIARSRRNFLTNWAYSPYMYNRTYVWSMLSNNQLSSIFFDGSGALAMFAMSKTADHPMFDSIVLGNNTSEYTNHTLSGNDIYGKSTWRPRSSMASYYYNVSKLSDILSKREYLYRQFFENSLQVPNLPKHLCATPNNSIITEVKSSFLFVDPVNYSSEYSRDFIYTTAPYFKFAYLKSAAQSISNKIDSLPINTSMLTNYTLFYFFNSETNNLGRNQDLYKDQYRPLKKGISSMLRLHATGAVAMPIEIRLQVLASSRDVIHSWAIPSASIKIDCVPGYTSHRMMKFLLTGVYWGQCQEICGRYHHWMPIVVYFMKRDLFFLWCTHFIFAPAPNEVWDSGDRQFADLIRFASYDKSSWLNEFGYAK